MVELHSLTEPRKTKAEKNAISRITEWKSVIIDAIMNDDELTKLLHYDTTDASFRPNLTDEERRNLYNTKIFGYRYNPEIVDEATQFLTIGVSRFAPREGFRKVYENYTDGFIYFYVVVNQQNMELENGYRQDLMVNRLHELFHDNRFIGLGNLKWANLVENWEHDNKLGGYALGFRVTELT